MGDYNNITKYAQRKPDGTKETWTESVHRIYEMHREKYKNVDNEELRSLLNYVEAGEATKVFLSAQRFRQFASADTTTGIFKHNFKAYNCSSTFMDRREVFGELMYVLLNGVGAGISVQKHHIDKLPSIYKPIDRTITFEIPDSIEGWADAVQILMDSYFNKNSPTVLFDYSRIRPAGSEIAGQFLAPGPDGLRESIEKIRNKIDTALSIKGNDRLKPIDVYDIAMYEAEAVLSGGVRRSAVLVLFDIFDDEMLNAKIGNYWDSEPQRAMSNNSAVIIQDLAEKDDFSKIIESVKSVGEPGFAIVKHRDIMYNPCFEIGMLPYFVDENGVKHSGWSVCNLTEINGGKIKTPDDFYKASKMASIVGTLQAGYTDFKYVSEWTQKIIERDALIGVSITGVMNNPDVLLDPEVLEKGAQIVNETNAMVADILGINHAKRTTAIKPAGNSSILLGTASGIHGEHAPRYIRNIKANKYEIGVAEVRKVNPFAVTPSTTSKTDDNIAFAIKPNPNSKFKKDLLGVKQLEAVKIVQKHWIIPGTVDPTTDGIEINHNVSNTISVAPDQWDEVRDYIWDNRDIFTGVSLLSTYGELEFADAPFQTVKTPEELVQEYGDAAVLASGLITDGLKVFDHIWKATDAARYNTISRPKESEDLMVKLDKNKKRDWVRRLKKFAKNYTQGDLEKAVRCLKEVTILHKYNKLKNEAKPIDWSIVDFSTEAMANAANIEAACAGGGCEVS